VSLSWQQLHHLIGVSPEGEQSSVFTGIAALDEAGPQDVSFLGNPRYQPQLAGTAAAVVLVPEGDFTAPSGCHLIPVANPSGAFSKLIDHFQQQSNPFLPGVSPAAHIEDGVSLDPAKVRIGPGAVVESGAVIGDGTTIGPACVIGRDVVIGQDCFLHPGAVIRERCTLGNRVTLQPSCVIGSDGYGFDLVDGRHQKVPQVGIVEIQDDVEVGANTCIDRARFGRTVIGEGTKIDNLVQIAHNVRIGKHCLIVAQSGVAGSSKLGNYVTIAAQAGVAGHLELADQAILSAQSGLLKNITEPGVFMGTPARPMKSEQRKMAAVARLPKLREELRELKKKLEEFLPE
jgi:UDP-3-O-[3-hydroxymyristoyl] glucosamine N-acyltransferase